MNNLAANSCKQPVRKISSLCDDVGLDEAILGSMNSCGDPEQDSKKIADLLKYGAHSLVGSPSRNHDCTSPIFS